jgi:hypothetical protein
VVHGEESGGRIRAGSGGGARPPRRASSVEWEWIICSGDEQSGVRGWCFNEPGVLHNRPPY